MKKLLLLLLGTGLLGATVHAQKTDPSAALRRCGTMEAIEQRLQADPAFRAEWERNQRAGLAPGVARTNGTQRTPTLTGPVTIPVIVHVVLPNPNQITEAQVDYFLSRLNLDFSGLNPDSANAGAFMPLRGHSQIRFARARRTPGGQLTNGIERRVGNVQIAGNTYQPIKHASAGGLDPWDVTQYYNLWVGDGGPSGLLGIAPNIGPGNATETTSSSIGIDGVCVDYRGFSNGCFSYPEFNLARTAVHEIGHNFGLFHSFTGCAAGADFGQITPNFTDPSLFGAAADDTPGQSQPTSGCLSGTVASNCAGVPNPPGKMYQNYMDYTDDACYSMFTINQVNRMHAVLEQMRPGYLTTQGHIPPPGTLALDATPTLLIAPGGTEFNNVSCTSTTYPMPICAGSVVPRIEVTNAGTSTITSVTVTLIVNGSQTVTTTATGLNILTGYGATVVLPAITLATGNNTLVFAVSNPNGGTDQNNANDVFTTSIVISGGTPPPLTEGFQSATFPPTGWTIYNPDGNATWQRSATAGFNSTASMYFDNWNNNAAGQIDELRSSPISVVSTDNIEVTFDVAHKPYSLTGSQDTLAVLVSKDCGQTWTEIYKKWGANLATVSGVATGAAYVPAGNGDWRHEVATVPASMVNAGSILVAVRTRGRFGNNVYVDNINIQKLVARDISVTAIVNPGTTVCNKTFVPQITVRNNGTETVTAYNVGYRINSGAVFTQTVTTPLAAGASATVTFNQAATAGIFAVDTIRTFTADPITGSGIGDANTANDTAIRYFRVINLATTPFVEGFEGAAFPPVGWTINNPNADMTWAPRQPGRNSLKSMFMDNWNNTDGYIDEIRMPAVNIGTPDSVAVSFDVAYKEYTGSPDTLALYASANCGNSFTSVYKKQGATLATAGAATAEFTAPADNEWRNERTVLTTPSLINTGSLIFYFRNTSRFGNNVFVDNINITPYYGRDLAVVSALPGFTVCDPAVAPSVVVKNFGTQTVTAFKVGYSINGGAAVVQNVTANLPRDASMTVTLANATFPAGVSTYKVWVADPVTASGTGDAKLDNDTLTRSVTLATKVAAPLVENFSGSSATAFPPQGWTVANFDNARTWTWSPTGNGNAGSATVNSFNYAGNNNVDNLVTPVVQYSNADSLTLSFDVAASSRFFPGSTTLALDTLEVLATSDCGATYQSVYKKWGQELQTVLDSFSTPNLPQAAGFVPTARATDWRSERISVTNLASQPQVQFVFRATTNNGNNIYIDNVNVTARTLPANLKANGYVISPNPMYGNTFRIWHLRQPTTLRYVNIYDAKGALVWSKSFGKKGAENVITVDLSGQPAGVYMVSLGYEDEYRNVIERVIKH
ncbi:MAG: T9SS type A sorting domain-containing protein [Chitinophagaceae bacterium]|nr:MAG: T9SS type A sorting domain-containing protein [Chitinophagaceae bacterium]